MLQIPEALDLVLKHAYSLPSSFVSLEESLGKVLADSVHADIDSPPFDKAQVDGYALRTADLSGKSSNSFSIGEIITAGRSPSRALEPREAAVIMTGAPIPQGCDAVVMHENTTTADGVVTFADSPIKPGQNVLRQGSEMRSGQVVLKAGTLLDPPHLGILASVGKTRVPVIPSPRVAIVPTGDELVEPTEYPGPGQIRNSNAVMLRALAASAGAAPVVFPIAPDESAGLCKILEAALASDLVLVTGGVSAGQRDLVPDALSSLGVERVFHKVSLKPGKPLWFGVGPIRPEGKPGALVFGLPGNPVSGLVSFVLFVRPALAALSGRPDLSPSASGARLAAAFAHRGDRSTYFPARLVTPAGSGGLPVIETLRWSGSADLLTIASADGFAVFPAGDRDYAPHDTVGFLPLR